MPNNFCSRCPHDYPDCTEFYGSCNVRYWHLAYIARLSSNVLSGSRAAGDGVFKRENTSASGLPHSISPRCRSTDKMLKAAMISIQYRAPQLCLHGRRRQCSTFTAPTGTLPPMIMATCRTVSIAWCSIACGVSPPMCGVAMTLGSFASSGVGI